MSNIYQPVRAGVKKYTLVIFLGMVVAVATFAIRSETLLSVLGVQEARAVVARAVTSPFLYNFNSNGILEEAGDMETSSSPYFWLNSGGRLVIDGGYGKTLQGPSAIGSKWQLLYAKSNPLDTENGTLPQNLFRLLTRSSWNNFTQEVKFKIAKVNLTDTPNRGGYSGILFFNRYKDSNNLYYAGIRMDGLAVIKKKVNGTYYTMATAPAFTSSLAYDKYINPNLIPTDVWMKMRTQIKDNADGTVSINVYLDKNNNGVWTQVVSAIDKDGKYGGSPTVKGAGYAGVRTDYMDVIFDDYRLTNL